MFMQSIQSTIQMAAHNPWASNVTLRDRLRPPVPAAQTAAKVQAAGIEPVKAHGSAPLPLSAERAKEIPDGSNTKRSFANVVTTRVPATAAAVSSAPEPHPFAIMSASPAEREAAFAASSPLRLPRAVSLTADVIARVRFSQGSVAKETKGEMSLAELKASIKSRWTGPRLPLVQFADGSLTSIGNRRLLACQWIIDDYEKRKGNSLNSVPVYLNQADEPVDENWIVEERESYFQQICLSHRADPGFRKRFQLAYEETLDRHGIAQGTYAELIYLRSRGGDLNNHVQGFTEWPRIRH